MRTAGLLTVVFALVLAQGGCLWSDGRFDPLQKGDALDAAQKRFTRFLRWNLLDKASELVDPELREEFLSETQEFRKLRFTDYEILTKDIGPDYDTATIEVVFHAYAVTTMLERAITIREEWYRDEETGNWWVRPVIDRGGDSESSELSQHTP